VNAIPSDTRAPRAGRSGRASLRDVASITGPLVDWIEDGRVVQVRDDPQPFRPGMTGGTWLAKRAGRGVPVARLTAHGRVGFCPRHIAPHLVRHRLLTARISAFRDADFTIRVCPVLRWPSRPEVDCLQAKRPKAQPLLRLSPIPEAGCTMLVPVRSLVQARARGQSPGKGVLAA
jgi:hypothetical protein